jgi:hypothetical protein
MSEDDEDYDMPSRNDTAGHNFEESSSDTDAVSNEPRYYSHSSDRHVSTKSAVIDNDLLCELIDKLKRPGLIFDEDRDFLIELSLTNIDRNAGSNFHREITFVVLISILVALLNYSVFLVVLILPFLCLTFFRQGVQKLTLSLVFGKYVSKCDEFLSSSKRLVKYLKQVEQASLSSEREFNLRDGVKIDLNLRDTQNTKYRREFLLRTRETFFSLKELNSLTVQQFNLGKTFVLLCFFFFSSF